MKFWAKTTKDGMPGMSVIRHMENVGRVAQSLAACFPRVLGLCQLKFNEIGALAALHDIGKISPGFQSKCEAWLQENGLTDVARNGVWDTRMESDHGKVTHMAVQKYLSSIQTDRKTAKFVSAMLGGHHGRLNRPEDRGYRPNGETSDARSGIDWEQERVVAAETICKVFSATLAELNIDNSSPCFWWLAGLVTVADWIGSNELFFPTEETDKSINSEKAASEAVAQIDFFPPDVSMNLSFKDLFGFAPNKMQVEAMAKITGPGIYIIEAPMGMGKTEAALGAAYQLLASKQARGIYFALPTQATSNRIHLRMAEFVGRISQTNHSIKLIHGNSWLANTTEVPQMANSGEGDFSDDARARRDWFASTKRALLAPFGVGTVDQALMSIVAAKHFFVRHFALAGKVIIIDEVHSYDLYTGTLIDCLIKTLESLECTVIVLSATLSGKRREKIIQWSETEDDPVQLPYPLILARPKNTPVEVACAAPPNPRKLRISFETRQEAAFRAMEVAAHGGCVLWICDTVNAAQSQFLSFQEVAGDSFKLGLLHSRFPYWRREQLENEWMERLGKTGETRCGSILVSTQIVEQSVDLDADLLVTELAPTDMLLQRTGRLWRHERKNRPVSEPHLVILQEAAELDALRNMSSDAIRKTLGGKAWVYDPYVLLRSLEVWKQHQYVEIPCQIRSLIEQTYKELEAETVSWQKLYEDSLGKALALRQKALQSSNIWTIALADDEGVQTRIDEQSTLSLVLCKEHSKATTELINGENFTHGGVSFCLKTAQAIHRNLVKIPMRHFDAASEDRDIARYLRGSQRIGLVSNDGSISVEGLKDRMTLHWSADLGVVIGKAGDNKEN